MKSTKTVRLGDVCEISIGRTPPRSISACWDAEKASGNVWLSISDLNTTENGIVTNSKEYVSDYAVSSCGMSLVKKGTLLVSFKLTLGRTAIAGRDLFTNEAIAALSIRDTYKGQIDQKYLIAFFAYFDWGAYASGNEKVLGKTLNKQTLAEIPIPLPSLSEQEAIVARLDAALARATRLAEHFATIAQNADLSFKATLAETFARGAEESSGSRNTRKPRNPREPSQEWPLVRLGDVCETITDGDHQPPPQSPSGIPFLVISNVAKGRLCFENTRFVPEEYYNSIPDFKKPKSGDVLLTVTGSFGIPVLVDGKKPFCFQRHIALLRPRNIETHFLAYLLASPQSFEYFDHVATGTAQKTVSLSSLRKMAIPLPPISVQRDIVARLDAARARCEGIAEQARRGAAAAENLKKALLKEAFE